MHTYALYTRRAGIFRLRDIRHTLMTYARHSIYYSCRLSFAAIIAHIDGDVVYFIFLLLPAHPKCHAYRRSTLTFTRLIAGRSNFSLRNAQYVGRRHGSQLELSQELRLPHLSLRRRVSRRHEGRRLREPLLIFYNMRCTLPHRFDCRRQPAALNTPFQLLYYR